QALKGEELALKVAQDQYGPTSLSLVPILNDKGILEWDLAQYRQAEQDFKWGLALLEKNLGAGDPKLADSLDLLAGLYADLNRLEEARLLEKRSLTLRQEDMAGDAQAIAHSQELLGRIELGLKDSTQALVLFQSAQKSLEKSSNADPILSINLWRDLGRAHILQQDNPQASSCWEKALETAQKNFTPESAQVADAMLDLADFDRNHGAGDKSGPLYESALKIARQFVGTNYDYSALPHLRRLARIYEGMGDNKSAIAIWKKILRTEKAVLGAQHPRVALDLENLAETERSLGQKGKAQADLKESLSILEHFFPADHPLVLQAKGLLSQSSKE
ncbi:MAG TPA: tetratricopeptide repeat protein, partial [bacterium]|nr:tetratricopeptide repeat protein [bacterium]